MIRIFVSETIIFLEDFDLSFFYDTFFNNTYVIYEPKFGWVNNKYYTRLDLFGLENFYTNPERSKWIIHPVWQRLLVEFYSVTDWSMFAIFRVLWWRMNDLDHAEYIVYYSQYVDLNFITGQATYNPRDLFLDVTVDYRITDWALFRDILYFIWEPWQISVIEEILGPYGMVFYRPRTYRYEWLIIGFENLFPPSFYMSIINPIASWMDVSRCSSDILYARQWLLMTYMTFDKYAFFPWDALWLSNYFSDFFYFYRITYNYNSLFTLGDRLISFLQLYFILNILYLFSLYIIFTSNKAIIYYYFFLVEPYIILRYVVSKIFIITAYVRRSVRLKRMQYFKKFNKKLFRKSQIESYYFNLLRNYVFRRIIYLYHKYIHNYKNYFNVLQKNFLCDSNDFKLNFINWLIFFYVLAIFFLIFYNDKNYFSFYIYILLCNNKKNFVFF